MDQRERSTGRWRLVLRRCLPAAGPTVAVSVFGAITGAGVAGAAPAPLPTPGPAAHVAQGNCQSAEIPPHVKGEIVNETDFSLQRVYMETAISNPWWPEPTVVVAPRATGRWCNKAGGKSSSTSVKIEYAVHDGDKVLIEMSSVGRESCVVNGPHPSAFRCRIIRRSTISGRQLDVTFGISRVMSRRRR